MNYSFTEKKREYLAKQAAESKKESTAPTDQEATMKTKTEGNSVLEYQIQANWDVSFTDLMQLEVAGNASTVTQEILSTEGDAEPCATKASGCSDEVLDAMSLNAIYQYLSHNMKSLGVAGTGFHPTPDRIHLEVALKPMSLDGNPGMINYSLNSGPPFAPSRKIKASLLKELAKRSSMQPSHLAREIANFVAVEESEESEECKTFQLYQAGFIDGMKKGPDYTPLRDGEVQSYAEASWEERCRNESLRAHKKKVNDMPFAELKKLVVKAIFDDDEGDYLEASLNAYRVRSKTRIKEARRAENSAWPSANEMPLDELRKLVIDGVSNDDEGDFFDALLNAYQSHKGDSSEFCGAMYDALQSRDGGEDAVTGHALSSGDGYIPQGGNRDGARGGNR